jgi:hypothetical protein
MKTRTDTEMLGWLIANEAYVDHAHEGYAVFHTQTQYSEAEPWVGGNNFKREPTPRQAIVHAMQFGPPF